MLAESFEKGNKLPKNIKLVNKCYENASTYAIKNRAHEEIINKYFLGLMYEKGRGVNKNLGMAAMWYEEAAVNGHRESLLALGFMYVRGDRTFSNKDIAPNLLNTFENLSKYLHRLAESGDGKACYILGWLYEHYDSSQEKQKEALDWYHLAAFDGDIDSQNALVAFYKENGISNPCEDKELDEALNQTSHGYLNLERRQITEVGVKKITNFLDKKPQVLKLIQLCGNPICDAGAVILAKSICFSRASVTGLFLGNCEIGDKGAEALAEMLQFNESIKYLALWGNNITDRGFKAIVKAISESSGSALQCLWLTGNKINERELVILENARHKLKSITISADAKVSETLQSILQRNHDIDIWHLNKHLQVFLDSHNFWSQNFVKEFDSSYDKLLKEIRSRWFALTDEARIYNLIISKILSCAKIAGMVEMTSYLQYLFLRFPGYWSAEQLVQYAELNERCLMVDCRINSSMYVENRYLDRAFNCYKKANFKIEYQTNLRTRVEYSERSLKLFQEMRIILDELSVLELKVKKEKSEINCKQCYEVIEKGIVCFESLSKLQSPQELHNLQERYNNFMLTFLERRLIKFIDAINEIGNQEFFQSLTSLISKYYEVKKYFSGSFCSGLGRLYEYKERSISNFQESLKWYKRALEKEYPSAEVSVNQLEKKIKCEEERLKREEEALKRKEKIQKLSKTCKDAIEALNYCTREIVLAYPGGTFAFFKKHIDELGENFRTLETLCSRLELTEVGFEKFNPNDAAIRLSMMISEEQAIKFLESCVDYGCDKNIYFRLGILYEKEMDVSRKNNKLDQVESYRNSARDWYDKARSFRHAHAQNALILLHFKCLDNDGLTKALTSPMGNELLTSLNSNFQKLHSNWEVSNNLGQKQNSLTERQLDISKESIEVARQDVTVKQENIKAIQGETKAIQEQTKILSEQLKSINKMHEAFLVMMQQFKIQWEANQKENHEFFDQKDSILTNSLEDRLQEFQQKIRFLEDKMALLDQKQQGELRDILQLMMSDWFQEQQLERSRKEAFDNAIKEIKEKSILVPSVYEFYRKLFLRLHGFFQGQLALASNALQRKAVGIEDKVASILSALGNIFTIAKPATGFLAAKLRASADKKISALADKVNELIHLNLGYEKLNNLIIEITLGLIRKYGDQICYLSLKGAGQLANAAFKCIEECIKLKETNDLFCSKIYLDFVTSADIPRLREYAWSEKIDKSIESGKTWSCEGVFLHTGVKILNDDNLSFCYYTLPKKGDTRLCTKSKYYYRLEDSVPVGYLPSNNLSNVPFSRPLLFEFGRKTSKVNDKEQLLQYLVGR